LICRKKGLQGSTMFRGKKKQQQRESPTVLGHGGTAPKRLQGKGRVDSFGGKILIKKRDKSASQGVWGGEGVLNGGKKGKPQEREKALAWCREGAFPREKKRFM